ncbi:MAG: sulfatase-like hydrolase/transferase [Myxococcales bacterium]|nr:sulfatase-like hydrolase/transferase [Myxococcales bacterium]MDH3485018.1 sulfatase-like hydrolase/transferase [Myxococcales bacterium]
MNSGASRDSKSVYLIVSFLVAGWLFGGVEAAFIQTTEPRALVIGFGAMLATLPALLLGIAVWLCAVFMRRLPASSRVSACIDRTNNSDPNIDCGPMIRANAYVFAGIIVLSVALVGSLLVYPRLFGLQLTRMGLDFAILFAVVQVYAAVVGIPVLWRLLHGPMSTVERRFGSPSRRPLWLGYLLVIMLPAFLGIYPVVLRHATSLGYASDVSVAALLVCAGIQVALLLSMWRVVRSKLLLISSLILAVCLSGGVAVAYAPFHKAAEASEAALLPSLGGRLARTMTDVDGDGVSSLFGAADCAPFNSARAPNQTELDNNGIDEDCDGSDGRRADAEWEATSAVAPLDPQQVRKYNILWVVLEAARADHLPAYGYDKPTMPYFSELAEDSLLFEDAYTQSSATVFSLQSMLSGVLPSAIHWDLPLPVRGVYGSGQPSISKDQPMIAERLRAQGYKTGIVLENYVHSTLLGLRRGFQKVYVGEPDRSRELNRPRRNGFAYAKAADFIARVGPDEHFFLFVYFFDSHGAYTRHADIDSSEFSRDSSGNYDTELAWTDEWLRALVETVRSRRMMWDDTIVIVTADHGEEFNDHGGHSHAQTCYREVSHVPLLLRVPGIASRRVGGRVALVDVVPTIMDLVGNDTPRDGLSGQSLLIPALSPTSVDSERPVFCSIASINAKHGVFFRRSVRQGDYALFQDVSNGDVALFDTTTDPAELNDLSRDSRHATRVEALKARLRGSLTGNLHDHEHMKKSTASPSPPASQ